MVTLYAISEKNNFFAVVFWGSRLFFKNSAKRLFSQPKEQKRIHLFSYNLGYLVCIFIKQSVGFTYCFIVFRNFKKAHLYFYKGFKKEPFDIRSIFFSKKVSFNGCKKKKKRRL